METPLCYFHHDRPAVMACEKCGKSICESCITRFTRRENNGDNEEITEEHYCKVCGFDRKERESHICNYICSSLVFSIIFMFTLSFLEESTRDEGDSFWVAVLFVGISGLLIVISCIGIVTAPNRKRKIRYDREMFLENIRQYNMILDVQAKARNQAQLNRIEETFCIYCGHQINTHNDICAFCGKTQPD